MYFRLRTFIFSVSPKFVIFSLLVLDAGQGFPIRLRLVSDSVLLWFPNRFSSVPYSRLGFEFAFCWFPIRLIFGFRVVFSDSRRLVSDLIFAGFRFGVSDSSAYQWRTLFVDTQRT